MKADDLKLYAATIVAMVLAIGAPILLVWVLIQPTDTMDPTAKAGITALLGGMSTYGIQFLFGRDIAAGSARQTERAVAITPGDPLNPFGLPAAHEDVFVEDDIVPDGEGDVHDDHPINAGNIAPH
jgi:hypothetical protein